MLAAEQASAAEARCLAEERVAQEAERRAALEMKIARRQEARDSCSDVTRVPTLISAAGPP